MAVSNISTLWKHPQNMESVKTATSTVWDTKILALAIFLIEIGIFMIQMKFEYLDPDSCFEEDLYISVLIHEHYFFYHIKKTENAYSYGMSYQIMLVMMHCQN